MEIRMDVDLMTTSNNQFYKTRAVVWVENRQVRSVYYVIAPEHVTAEVWEGYECISTDLGFAIAYLRGAGFKDVSEYESLDGYRELSAEVNDQFNDAILEPVEDDDDIF